MALPVVAGFLDVVGVVAGSLDDAGVGALAALVQVLGAGDVGGDLVEDVLTLVRPCWLISCDGWPLAGCCV